MEVSTATRPGRLGRGNEDFVVAGENTVVPLDGAGNPPGAEQGCSHGVAWFVRVLGTKILNHATDHPDDSLTASLREAIEGVAEEHRHSCDLRHPGSPSSTVVVLRQMEDTWQYLVLADSTLLLDHGSRVEVITDNREAEIGRAHRTEMDSLPSGSPEHAETLRRYVETLRAYRNQPGGFWVASSEPGAADHAITGHAAITDVTNAALLSDGASRLVDRFALVSWTEIYELLAHAGPSAVIDQVREAELRDPTGEQWPRGKVSDDATAAHVRICNGIDGF